MEINNLIEILENFKKDHPDEDLYVVPYERGIRILNQDDVQIKDVRFTYG